MGNDGGFGMSGLCGLVCSTLVYGELGLEIPPYASGMIAS